MRVLIFVLGREYKDLDRHFASIKVLVIRLLRGYLEISADEEMRSVTDAFVHLHTHSSYSLLDGLGRIDDLVEAAKSQKAPALALTDHGVMFGAIDFYSRAHEAGVKPIIGCEVYVADRPLEETPDSRARSYHLLLLAENEIGYRNLIRLTTDAHLRGFYRKPRVDHALLETCSEGIICLSGCASSEVPSLILADRPDLALERADWYRQIFRDRYYMELQDHGLDFDGKIIDGVTDISRKIGAPLVATNDVHYVQAAHAPTHEVLLCIQTQTLMSDSKRMRLETPEFYLKSADEMAKLFGHVPNALSNTLAIAERCNLDLDFGRPQLPRFVTPDGQSSEEYLRSLCAQGLERRYPQTDRLVEDRLQYELDVISRTGFVDYFLLVYDVIHFARSRGIGVGPGRGSAAGSLVAYALFLTNVDPIAHDLSFERFLNPERVTMPDMDLDFADDRRDEVIRYVTEKYGRDRVAQIITFGTLGPRAGVRDVGRVRGMSLPDVDRVAKLIPFMCSRVSTAKEEAPELQRLYDSDPGVRDLLDTAETLEGVARHASTHAAGVVIARDPLIEHVPLYKVPKNDQIVTQYAMASIEKIGLLKMDFLGLRTLTVLQRAGAFIRQSTACEFDIDSIDLNDRAIYDLLSTGETFGVFQLDSAGMRRLLRELRPETFEHIVAVNALYRPGPMEQIPKYVARRHAYEDIDYVHPILEEVLRPTYGIVVYQEQVMRLFSLVAGYSLGEADLIRRAMGKKKIEELRKHHAAFLDRAEERGTDRATAGRLWDIVLPFAGYAFNKSHATAYGVIACQTAYLKATFPREFMAALMSAEIEYSDRLGEAMAECRRLGIDILPPDINQSDADFSLHEQGIRMGLCAIKHVGSAAIESVLAVRRDGGPFSSLSDFCARVDWGLVNKRVVESLARCGAFDCLGDDRNRIVEGLDRIVAFGAQIQRSRAAGLVSLFGEEQAPEAVLQLGPAEPATLEDKLAWEQDLLGIFVSPHPLTYRERELRESGAEAPSQLSSETDARRARAAGMLRGLQLFRTKAGQPMAIFQLADLRAGLDVVVFSRTYERVGSRLVEGSIVVVDGKLDVADGKARLLADAVLSVEEALSTPPPSDRKIRSNGRPEQSDRQPESVGGPERTLAVEMHRTDDRDADLARIQQLYELLQRYPGRDGVEIAVVKGQRRFTLTLPNRLVGLCPELEEALRHIMPAGSWTCKSAAISPAQSPASG